MNGRLLSRILFLTCCTLSSSLVARQTKEGGEPPTKSALSRDFIAFSKDSVLQLPDEFIESGSDSVFEDSVRVLTRGVDYVIDLRFGAVHLNQSYIAASLRDSVGRRLTVRYRALSVRFRREYFLHTLIFRSDSAGNRKVAYIPPASHYLADDLFGPDLQKSGSIARGFSVGTNRDLSLTSGLRLQLAGPLSNDINIVAALTDENSPIQPEGTTQTLREVDKVFIEISSRHYGATLGDFTLDVPGSQGGEFGRLSRKLQGAEGTADVVEDQGNNGRFSVVAATSRGKYNTNQFQGIEGVQGPYLLTGKNGEEHLIIIAGSEKVYLDGNIMTRGETNDYTIDYGDGEVTFSSRRLITNASRIVIDFQYSDEQYTRNILGATADVVGFDRAASLHLSFFQEADDETSPTGFTLDDSSRTVLENAGADRLRASLPGIQFIGRDSTGAARGQYRLVDTVISGRPYAILVYAPGDSLALYSATFAPVNVVPPDSAGYVRVAAGNFQFAGIGAGSYLPIVVLPLPQLQRLMDLNGSVNLASDLSVSGEYAASQLNQNRFSSAPDVTVDGGAYLFSARYHPQNLRLFGTGLGDLDVSASDRFVERTFSPMDRTNDIEFNRTWNLDTAASSNEEIRQGHILYSPSRTVHASFDLGDLERSGDIHSSRTQEEVALADSSLPTLLLHREEINSMSDVDAVQSSWVREQASTAYRLPGFTPSLRIEAENRSARESSTDSLNDGSFRILEITPGVTTRAFLSMNLSAEFQLRQEDSVAAGVLGRASSSLTQLYSLQFPPSRSFSSSLTLDIRKKQFTEEFKQRGNVDGDFILVRSQTRYAPLDRAAESDWYYQFSSERSARLERLFVRVAKGTGNYIYLGDLNGNGIADDDEFQLTRFDGDYVAIYLPTDQLFPVVSLQASIRLRLQPARILSSPSSGFERLLRNISTETYLRIDEKSTDSVASQIYFLDLSHFQDSRTTISGSDQLTQDVYLFENNPELSLRFRFGERHGLSQYVESTERSYGRERSVRIRSQLVKEIGNQTDIVFQNDRVLSSVISPRTRDLQIASLTSDFSYRPEPAWEVGFTLAASQTENTLNQGDAVADVNQQGLRVLYSIPEIGQLRSEIRREEVDVRNVIDDDLHPQPYEFTDGKVVGKSIFWELGLDYRIGRNLQLTLNYDGRSEGGRSPVHTARAEARASF